MTFRYREYMGFHYDSYLGITLETEEPFSKGDNFEKLVNNNLPLVGWGNFYAENRLLMAANGLVDCRETLIKRVMDDLEGIPSDCRADVMYVRFADDSSGTHLPSGKRKYIRWFGETLFNGDKSIFHMEMLPSGNAQLSMNISNSKGENNSNLAALSFILYLFRNEDILQWCKEKVEENDWNLRQMFENIAYAFLEDRSWGDSYNENVSLSLFAYSYAAGAKAKKPSLRHSGPEAYADTNLADEVMQAYADTVVASFLEKNGRISEDRRTVKRILPIHSTLRDNLHSIISKVVTKAVAEYDEYDEK